MTTKHRSVLALLLFAAAFLALHSGLPAAAKARRAVAWVVDDQMAPPSVLVARLPFLGALRAPPRSDRPPPPSFRWPLPGPARSVPGGIVVVAPAGALVVAATSGRVASLSRQGGVGAVVERHGAWRIRYVGLGTVFVRAGQRLAAGEGIGVLRRGAGPSGTLLLQVREGDVAVSPFRVLPSGAAP